MRFLAVAENHTHNEERGISSSEPKPESEWENEDDFEFGLRYALIERKMLLAATTGSTSGQPASGTTAFERARAFHATQSHLQTESLEREARLKELGALIARIKSKLTTFGFRLDGNGMIVGYPDDANPSRVVYDHDPVLQGSTQVHVAGGKLYSDSNCKTLLDTTKSQNFWSGEGVAIFVMTASGGLHVSSQLKDYRHHSSLLAGANVACAGEIRVEKGVVKMVSNKSGHYRPDSAHLYQLVHQFKRYGVPLEFQVIVYAAGGKTKTYTPLEFLKKGRLEYEFYRFVAYLDAAGPELINRLGWELASLYQRKRKPGVYDKTTGKRLDYKFVIGRLKAEGVTPEARVLD